MRRWIPAALFLVASIAGVFLYFHPTVDVRLSKGAVQEAIEKELPLAGRKLGIRYEVTAAAADLRPDGRIALDAEITVSALGRTAHVHASGSGTPVYRDGAFYLFGFSVEKASLVKSESGPDEKSLIFRTLGRIGVNETHASLENSKDALVQKAKEAATELIGAVLDRHPVYRLKPTDMKQSLARVALRDVKVENGTLVLTLDPLSAVIRVLTTVVMIILALAAAYLFIRLGGLRLLAAAQD